MRIQNDRIPNYPVLPVRTNINTSAVSFYNDLKAMETLTQTPPPVRQEKTEQGYHLTDEQITYFKSKYDISNISTNEFHQLMDELTVLGVVNEGDGNILPRVVIIDGYETKAIRAPLPPMTGPDEDGVCFSAVMKKEHADRFRIFGSSRSEFQSGDIVAWLLELKLKNENNVEWLKNDASDAIFITDPRNTALMKQKTISGIEEYNRLIGRIRDVLEQLR